MKKKRVVFPETVKEWIDARSTYKLTHAQVEMARELGIDPKKFEGIAAHLLEQAKPPLPAFIEASYRERFGKNRPDDIRSVEQKLKAELAQKEQKRTLKSLGKAAAKWEAIPETVRATLLENVWCSHCVRTTTITDIECQTVNDGLLLNGKCATCGNRVGRYIEGA